MNHDNEQQKLIDFMTFMASHADEPGTVCLEFDPWESMPHKWWWLPVQEGQQDMCGVRMFLVSDKDNTQMLDVDYFCALPPEGDADPDYKNGWTVALMKVPHEMAHLQSEWVYAECDKYGYDAEAFLARTMNLLPPEVQIQYVAARLELARMEANVAEYDSASQAATLATEVSELIHGMIRFLDKVIDNANKENDK